jgi:alpha,alpha-trehalase
VLRSPDLRRAAAALAIGLASLIWCGFAQPVRADAAILTPAEVYQELFYDVQMRRILGDGKTFVDAVPKAPPAEILAAYRAVRPLSDAQLLRFIRARFELPNQAPAGPPSTARPPLAEHIARLWPVLTHTSVTPPPGATGLALAHPYVAPGGRFREMYYWDSYFTLLGLAQDGRGDLVDNMVDNFVDLIAAHGHVPNGTRTYYLGRSQPPVFYLMVKLADRREGAVFAARLAAMRREHAFWMDGESQVAPGQAHRRVVRLPDGTLLNRYADSRERPRDESFREDVLAARASRQPPGDLFRELRSAAESGWDFSSRWFADGRTLATTQTTAILPVDLNSLLFGMEQTIAADCRVTGDLACDREFSARATARRQAMDAYFWDPASGYYHDYQWRRRERRPGLSAATLFPLFVGAASAEQARAVAVVTRERLLASGGLRTTEVRTGEQWDAPNGWAPLQWIAVEGLRRHDETALAAEIAARWLRTVQREYLASGRMLEKYDVEEVRPGGGGEYPLQDGFGWTNGVTRAFLALYPQALAQAPASATAAEGRAATPETPAHRQAGLQLEWGGSHAP